MFNFLTGLFTGILFGMGEVWRPLPKDEDGFIKCSAEYGESWIVEITWTTDFDGRHIDEDHEDYARTYHGTFLSLEEANQWIYDFPEFKDIADMVPIIINSVRPAPFKF